jgi:cell wall-associated NlpC family hydrolase
MSNRTDAVLAEARTWLGTPYHHMGRLKGIGVDCAGFVEQVFHAVLDWPLGAWDHYPEDWNHHRDEERLLDGLAPRCRAAINPKPGDIVAFKLGRTFAHAGIVTAWPQFIHAMGSTRGGGCVEIADADQPPFKGRAARFFRPRRFIA